MTCRWKQAAQARWLDVMEEEMAAYDRELAMCRQQPMFRPRKLRAYEQAQINTAIRAYQHLKRREV